MVRDGTTCINCTLYGCQKMTNCAIYCRKRLGLTQTELAEKLGVSQQTVSKNENAERPSESYMQRFRKAYPEIDQFLGEITKRLTPTRVMATAERPKRDPPMGFPEVEPEALPWAYTHRNKVLLQQIDGVSRISGMVTERVSDLSDTIIVKRGSTPRTRTRQDVMLFSIPAAYGLTKNTLLILGSPYRHPLSELLLPEIQKIVGGDFALRYSDANRPFYFGYMTTFVCLQLGKETWHPARKLAEDDTDDLIYEDFGAIVHMPVDEVFEREQFSFLEDVEQVVHVMGCHRLATGAAISLCLDADLQQAVLNESGLLDGTGVLTFRVEARGGTRQAIETVDRLKHYRP